MFGCLTNLNINNYIIVDESNVTTNHWQKIKGKHFRTTKSKNYFFNPIVNK